MGQMFIFVQENSSKLCGSREVEPHATLAFHQSYIGKWYVYFIYEYPDAVSDSCLTWDFLYYDIERSNARCIEVFKNLDTDEMDFIDSDFHFDMKRFGQYKYHWRNDIFPEEDVKIIATDYSNYAIQWSCYDLPKNQSQTFLYVTTRKRDPQMSTSLSIKQILEANGIDISNIRTIVHDSVECPYS